MARGGIGQLNLTTYNMFVQDDWKFSPNLTLNLGVRWELPLPPAYLFNRYNCWIDGSGGRDNPVQIVPKDFPIESDFVTGGDLSVLTIPFRERDTERCQELRLKYWAPRVGLGLAPVRHQPHRAARGHRHLLRPGRRKPEGGSGLYRSVSRAGQRGSGPRRRRLRIILGNLPESAARRCQSTEHVTDYFYDSTYQEGAVYGYSASIQHELVKGTKLEVAYVGNQGRHIRNLRFWNVAMPRRPASAAPDRRDGSTYGTQRDRRPYP